MFSSWSSSTCILCLHQKRGHPSFTSPGSERRMRVIGELDAKVMEGEKVWEAGGRRPGEDVGGGGGRG